MLFIFGWIQTKEIINNLVKVFKRRHINKFNWLDQNSKTNIGRKLDAFKLVVGKLNKSKQDVVAYYDDVRLCFFTSTCC